MGYEEEFSIKYNPKKFWFSNNWYFKSIYVESWIIVYFPLLTEMYALSFRLGKFEAISSCPVFNSI